MENMNDSAKYHHILAEQLNNEMTMSVLPVTVFVGIEMFLGFIGNMLVLYVFTFRYHICNFRYFVLCLAFVDILSSLTTMPGEIVTHIYWYIYPVPVVCKIKSFFNVFTVSAEALCLLTIALDRYLKVCRPLGWQIKPRSAQILCGIIYVCAFVLAFPVAIFWGTHSHEKNYKNVTINVTVCEKDEHYEMTKHPLQYSVSIEGIVSTCLIIMFGLYVFVAKRLLQNRRKRRDSMRPGTAEKTTGLKKVQFPTSSDFNDTSTVSDINDTKTGELRSVGSKQLNLSPEMTEEDFCSVVNSNDTLENEADTITVDDDSIRRSMSLEQRNENRVKVITKRKTTPIKLRKPGDMTVVSSRIHRKTLIMFILTVVFITTTILYMTLLSFIAKSDDILQNMSDGSKAVYFLFFRLYFINHVINPIIYGFLDPKFRAVVTSIWRK